jgi:hypothetical protein
VNNGVTKTAKTVVLAMGEHTNVRVRLPVGARLRKPAWKITQIGRSKVRHKPNQIDPSPIHVKRNIFRNPGTGKITRIERLLTAIYVFE